jgi:hypothetical protein
VNWNENSIIYAAKVDEVPFYNTIHGLPATKDGYDIIKLWPKGYSLYFDGECIGNGERLSDIKAMAQDHIELRAVKGGNS